MVSSKESHEVFGSNKLDYNCSIHSKHSLRFYLTILLNAGNNNTVGIPTLDSHIPSLKMAQNCLFVLVR